MKVNIAISKSSISNVSGKVYPIKEGNVLWFDCDVKPLELSLTGAKKLVLFGDVFYLMAQNDRVKQIDLSSKKHLRNLFSDNKIEDVCQCLEGRYFGFIIHEKTKTVEFFSDKHARIETFYSLKGKDLFISTDLDFIFEHISPEYDQKMLAQFFSTYGWYTPKGFTIYKNVKQLMIGQRLLIKNGKIKFKQTPFKPLKIQEYGEDHLEKYFSILRNSILSRANKAGINCVSSSSGWDSSVILGILVDLVGVKNVRMLTGSMLYSKATERINQFELNKVKKIGKFYGIKPETVPLDYKNKRSIENWKKELPFFRSRHCYSTTTFNFAKLANGFSRHFGEEQTVFNGETSDSFHNFGFSQFCTFFHTSKAFTEYSDKMNCYLYGPSFFKKVKDGSFGKDKVFQIFIKMFGENIFDLKSSKATDNLKKYIGPFVYNAPRVPFVASGNRSLLTKKGNKEVFSFLVDKYVPQLKGSFSEQNIYSWLIYLYLCFHSQGSTVSVHGHSLQMKGHFSRMPFNDLRMIEFLSQAPENWGRGLDINHTKYPLKWVAKNKIKFPYDILEKGPHSYLYDVIEGFSLAQEIVYRSAATGFFKEVLSEKAYKNILSDEYFSLRYLDGLVDGYLKGRQVSGKGFNDLLSLITLSITGWYQ